MGQEEGPLSPMEISESEYESEAESSTGSVLWQPLDTQGPMISLMSKPQRRSIMWEFTRELDKEPLLN